MGFVYLCGARQGLLFAGRGVFPRSEAVLGGESIPPCTILYNWRYHIHQTIAWRCNFPSPLADKLHSYQLRIRNKKVSFSLPLPQNKRCSAISQHSLLSKQTQDWSCLLRKCQMRNSVAFVVVPYPTLYYRPIAYILIMHINGSLHTASWSTPSSSSSQSPW